MVMFNVQGGVSLQQRTDTEDGKLSSAFSRFCRCFLFLVYTDLSNLTKLFTTLVILYPMLLSLDGLAATPFAPFRVKFFYSSMSEKLCIFLMVVLLVLSRQLVLNSGRDGLPKLSTSVVAQPEIQATD